MVIQLKQEKIMFNLLNVVKKAYFPENDNLPHCMREEIEDFETDDFLGGQLTTY